jgi:glycerol-3-phosphate dehydrogenase
MTDQHCDLTVIGSGAAGQKGVINAAKLGTQVAVVERDGIMWCFSPRQPEQLVRQENDHRIDTIHDI